MAILQDVALVTAGSNPETEADDLGVPDEIVRCLGLDRLDEALSDFGAITQFLAPQLEGSSTNLASDGVRSVRAR